MEKKQKQERIHKNQNLSLKSQLDNPKILNKLLKKQIVFRNEIPPLKKVPMFSHLPHYEPATDIVTSAAKYKNIIPSDIVYFCVKRSKSLWDESNTNVVELLQCIRSYIANFKPSGESTPGVKSELEVKINLIIQFVSDCTGINIAMGNAIKSIKLALSETIPRMHINKAKTHLLEHIDAFVSNRINIPREKIIKNASTIICASDIIMINSLSEPILSTVLAAKPNHVYFATNLIIENINDSLLMLSQNNIQCTVISISAISLYIKKCTKVIFDALAVFSNGTILALSGGALLALAAHENNVSVLTVCESFKFTERVQLDPIVFNEIDTPDCLLERSKSKFLKKELENWRNLDNLKILNLRYDIVPSNFVTQVITEYGSVPTSSIPIIICGYNK